ncbi:conserved hypothetical protein [Methanococcus vannielii SB]|uniref:DUF4391 domain-containing protein n=1 Tax=Methanococcus vannielii (strain ATCC 35089 / DSM 1224 / JCM 13029 / OCM 148 / SB) TaxID=406327 RepID=A6UNJ2_METVS|nr:DUF4391 domain-containing protein [Methanococcus vannielii]ABR54064.1 conserved hypothetical protein [Methanococcus vannielii SB]
MIHFPKSTEVLKKIPKNKFYNIENCELDRKTVQKFTDYIDSIYITNKISKHTININPTKNFEELLVFQVNLKDKKYFEKIEELLEIIDKFIPYPILFQIIHNDYKIYKIAHKTKNKIDSNKCIVDIYLTKENFDTENSNMLFNSNNLDIFYERLLKLFLDDFKIPNTFEDNDDHPEERSFEIEKSIENYKKFRERYKELEILEKKVLKEKQPDKQFKIYNEIKRIKKELEK